MLPVSTELPGASKRSSRSRTSFVHMYLGRLLKPGQMDFQYSFWTMVQLCIAPKTAYRHTSYHKQTKNHWARDDPAFVVVEAAMVAVISLAYCTFFSHSLGRSLSTVLSAVFVEYLGIGCCVASAGWAVANRFLRRKHLHSHAVEQSVEWAYAFDVHCNGFLPLILLLGVGQLALSPLLLRPGLVPRLVSCLLYAAAIGHYLYLTFLGYSALPFLERAEVLMYPMLVVLLAVPLAVLAGLNPTQLVLRIYFGWRPR